MTIIFFCTYIICLNLYIYSEYFRKNNKIKENYLDFYNSFVFKVLHKLVTVKDLNNLNIILQYFTWNDSKYLEVKEIEKEDNIKK